MWNFINDPKAGWDMPVLGRVRTDVTGARVMSGSTGTTRVAPHDALALGSTCALSPTIATADVAGYGRSMTDVVVAQGAFPGPSAWSPPI